MSIKTDLIGTQYVGGNFKDIQQTYHLYYYPPEQNFPTDKVWIYLDGLSKDNQPRTIRSLCFDNIETHRKFILNNILYHLYWLEKKGAEHKPSFMHISEFRKILLDSLMTKLRIKSLENLKEKIKVRV